jgi:hypothetical protein
MDHTLQISQPSMVSMVIDQIYNVSITIDANITWIADRLQ